MSAPRLSEIREADASPEITAVYSAIKTASGIPQVNLIWRHFATQPEILRWAWAALAPVWRSNVLAAEAAELLRAAADPDQPAIWETLQPSEAEAVRNVIEFYNHGNSQNMLALTGLAQLARFDERLAVSRRDAKPAPTDRNQAVASVPALPRRDDLGSDAIAVVDRLASSHGGSAIGVTPSMYLHLALWPQALHAAESALIPYLGSDRFRNRVAATIRTARSRADGLISVMDQPGERPAPEMLEPMLATLENFVTTTIPEMIVVGAYLSGDSSSRQQQLHRSS